LLHRGRNPALDPEVTMDAATIVRELGNSERLPVEALRTASANRAAVLPAFLQAIEDFLAGHATPETGDALFFIFHLLGEWREKTAYRPLAALLRRPRDEIDGIFGGAITETTHRVMAAVFDGDPAPLYDVIRDPNVDEFVRAAVFHALAMVTLRGELPREGVAQFLHASYLELVPQDECFVWDGWQSTVAVLGLEELRPLVKQAFERGFISRTWLRFEDFESDLQEALSGAPEPWLQRSGNFTLFGDTVEELSRWYAFSPERERDEKRAAKRRAAEVLHHSLSDGPAVNPFRDVGRNDPCPCGSGKKFKKCCLGKNVLEQGDIGGLPRRDGAAGLP
jgi:hypothetical protein